VQSTRIVYMNMVLYYQVYLLLLEAHYLCSYLHYKCTSVLLAQLQGFKPYSLTITQPMYTTRAAELALCNLNKLTREKSFQWQFVFVKWVPSCGLVPLLLPS